jgi:hypothetical protein
MKRREHSRSLPGACLRYVAQRLDDTLEPGELLGEWWTDGGVRSVTPIEAAIRATMTERPMARHLALIASMNP